MVTNFNFISKIETTGSLPTMDFIDNLVTEEAMAIFQRRGNSVMNRIKSQLSQSSDPSIASLKDNISVTNSSNTVTVGSMNKEIIKELRKAEFGQTPGSGKGMWQIAKAGEKNNAPLITSELQSRINKRFKKKS